MTVTIDPELVEAGWRAVAAGVADSMSGWVNLALVERRDRDERLARIRAAIAEYEVEFGEITDEELAARVRADRGEAAVPEVRGKRARTARSK
ncbi:MAG: hypothetical protein ACRDYC_10980 [Acidimicrobiales bacterium]